MRGVDAYYNVQSVIKYLNEITARPRTRAGHVIRSRVRIDEKMTRKSGECTDESYQYTILCTVVARTMEKNDLHELNIKRVYINSTDA